MKDSNSGHQYLVPDLTHTTIVIVFASLNHIFPERNHIYSFVTAKEHTRVSVRKNGTIFLTTSCHSWRRKTQRIEPWKRDRQVLHAETRGDGGHRIRYFIFGLRNEQFRFSLSQKLPETMREVLDQVQRWEEIPGYATKSRFSNPIGAVDNCRTECPLCDTNLHRGKGKISQIVSKLTWYTYMAIKADS